MAGISAYIIQGSQEAAASRHQLQNSCALGGVAGGKASQTILHVGAGEQVVAVSALVIQKDRPCHITCSELQIEVDVQRPVLVPVRAADIQCLPSCRSGDLV